MHRVRWNVDQQKNIISKWNKESTDSNSPFCQFCFPLPNFGYNGFVTALVCPFMCALLIGREIQLCTPGNPLKWMKEFPQKEQKLEESTFASIAIEQNSFEWNFEYEPKRYQMGWTDPRFLSAGKSDPSRLINLENVPEIAAVIAHQVDSSPDSSPFWFPVVTPVLSMSLKQLREGVKKS